MDNSKGAKYTRKSIYKNFDWDLFKILSILYENTWDLKNQIVEYSLDCS